MKLFPRHKKILNMLLSGHPLCTTYLWENTGISQSRIEEVLNFLRNQGLICFGRRKIGEVYWKGWILTQDGLKAALAFPENKQILSLIPAQGELALN